MLELRIHNTLSKEKELFIPCDPKHVRMYTCGPTVYNYAHIGNARPAVISDLLVRVLRVLYPKVTYASNITDIDDKIIKASQETGVPIDEITSKYEKIYKRYYFGWEQKFLYQISRLLRLLSRLKYFFSIRFL